MRFVTKQDYQQEILKLCEPLKKYFSEGKACLDIGHTATYYNNRTIELEAFARPLWGLVPFWVGGGTSTLEEIYSEGFKNGPNPLHPEYWGKHDQMNQAFVEMAAIGFGLLLAPDKIWDPLNEEEKKQLNEWLLQINLDKFQENNWLFFKVFVNIGLKNVGAIYSEKAIHDPLDIIETFYLGDGWYSDGRTAQRDYYIAFAIHFYSLIYAKTMKNVDSDRCERFVERAKIFAQDYIYWFTENGESLPYGRSLTYRFAQGCFWSALAFADVEVFSWGVMKGIINRHFRAWFNNPILDAEGKLTIGYTYPNLNMSEGYNAPGSPYWAFKSFLILALDDGHPYWQAKEEPLPKLCALKLQKHPKMLIQRLQNDHIVALTSGQYPTWNPVHSAEKYEKFAYSSYFGFNVPRSYYTLEQAVPDNMLAFLKDSLYHVRRKCDVVKIDEKGIYSKWSPMGGITVETVIEPLEEGHMRKHTIYSEIDCEAVECGFSLPTDQINDVVRETEGKTATIYNDKGYSSIKLVVGEGSPTSVLCEGNTNIVHPRVMMPYIKLDIKKGITTIETYVIGKRK